MDEERQSRLDYHHGFYASVRFLWETPQLTFLQEHELGEGPPRLDMLIVGPGGEAGLKDPVGSFFRGHDIIEYKSPEDALTIDDLYKAQAYACLYKSMAEGVDAVPIGEMTVSLFRHVRPRKMLAALERAGVTIEKADEGIWRMGISGPICVPTQVVVTSQLPSGYEAFKILARGAKREDVVKVLEEAYGTKSEHLSAILRVSMAANMELYRRLEEEGPMRDVFESIFHKELAEKEAKGIEKGEARGRKEGRLDTLVSLVRRGLLTLSVAASEAGMSEDELKARLS
ncbi:MAG: hypothetical protein IJR14_09350 [Synergistaceae bacterium]|nr:hypothetical protein [Synergistaceae bacterium]